MTEGVGAGQAVWVNGERRDPLVLHVSSRDRGLTLGDGVFETMRVHRGRVFRLDCHLARLEQALGVLAIPVVPHLRPSVLAAVDESGVDEGSVRLTVTRGIGPAGLAPPPQPSPTVLAVVGPLPAVPRTAIESGLHAHVASGRRNERSMTAGLKTLAYADAVAALLEARRAGADEALFLDTGDHLSGGSASNLFVLAGTTLLTPPLSCGVLPGITRAAVLDLAGELRLDVSERAFGLETLAVVSEAFLTSSLRGIAPVVRVDGRPVGEGVPGPVTRRIQEAYAGLLDRECR